MNLGQRLTVISFVGPSAAGKTTAMKLLDKKYDVLPERYMELNRHQLDNRLVLSKWAYIEYWFNGVLQARADGVRLLLTDRCPLDTCAYVHKDRSALLTVLTASISELATLDIIVRKVLTTAPFEILQARTLSRLNTEGERRSYHEAEEAHNRRAYNFYSEQTSLWDRIIDTSSVTESGLVSLFESVIGDLRPAIQ